MDVGDLKVNWKSIGYLFMVLFAIKWLVMPGRDGDTESSVSSSGGGSLLSIENMTSTEKLCIIAMVLIVIVALAKIFFRSPKKEE